MRKYIKPKIERVILDNSISLVMMSWKPGDGKPPSPPGRPFNSPFNDRPFN